MINSQPINCLAPAAFAETLSKKFFFPCTLKVIKNESDAEIVEMLSETDVFVTASFKASWRGKSRLQMVHSSGAGIDGIDLKSLPSGCRVCNVYGHERGVAEQAFLMMLALQRNLLHLDARLRKGNWSPVPAYLPEMRDRNLLILGLGHIGQELARWGNFLGMKVSALTRHPAKERAAKSGLTAWGGFDELEKFLKEADFVALAIPASPASRNLMGRREFEQMKPSAFLINVGRARVANEEALYQALKDKVIAGAGLDVWYDYPDSDDDILLPSKFPFQDLDNIIMTPHKPTIETMDYRWGKIAENIHHLIRGEPLERVVFTAP